MKERSLLNFLIHVFPLNRDTGPFGALSLHMDLMTASHMVSQEDSYGLNVGLSHLFSFF